MDSAAILANRATYSTTTPWFNTKADAAALTPKWLSDEASQWNNSLQLGDLTRQDIKDRVLLNAHNQNVYLESLEQRLESLEADPEEEQPRHRQSYIALQSEIADIKASSSDELSQVFNDKLTLLAERAHADERTEEPPPGANH